MVHRVYTIFDKVAKEAGPLFTAKNDMVAVRSFRIATKDVKEMEHALYYLGDFETEKCALVIEKGGPHEVMVPEVKHGEPV